MRKLLSMSLLLALALPAVAHGETGEAEAMTTAIGRAASAGLAGPMTVQSSGPVSRARAHAVLYSEPVSPTIPTSTAFPFVLNGNSTFEANVPVPRGASLPPMRYLAVTISPGWVEETYSPHPISIAKLGTVVTVSISRTQAVTAAQSCHVDQLLMSALGRKHLGGRLARAQRSLKKCETKHP